MAKEPSMQQLPHPNTLPSPPLPNLNDANYPIPTPNTLPTPPLLTNPHPPPLV